MFSQTSPSILVAQVRSALQQGDLPSAEAMISNYRSERGQTGELLEAESWIARGQLSATHYAEAIKQAEAVQHAVIELLGQRPLDAQPFLPTALGASYEVKAQALAETGQQSAAAAELQSALRRWKGTSIAARLQKNLNLLTITGRHLPPLTETEWIGKKPPAAAALQGKVVLLFFWAHWCPDCKAEAPVLAKLAETYGAKGLVIVAPTTRYGYTPANEHASAGEEKEFIERVFARYYASIGDISAPIAQSNFDRFGASTTPTLVLADRQGIIRLYHPGLMDEGELTTAIYSLLEKPHTAGATR